MPKVSIRAVQAALEAKKNPHHKPDATFFEVPNRTRASIAKLIGGKPEEVALTSGASAGVAAVAYALTWKPGDEVVTAKGEFPLQLATWKPMEEREGLKLKIVSPRDRLITADDLIAAMTPRTRLVSVSMVRYDDGSLLDAARVADACHKQGALLLLDASQSCGALPMDVKQLGVDFIVSAGYKWLLGPFGTGFFWAKSEHLAMVRPGPFYWMALMRSHNFDAMNFEDPKPGPSSKRWDAPESASYFNFNLVAVDASVHLVLRMGPEVAGARRHASSDDRASRLCRGGQEERTFPRHIAISRKRASRSVHRTQRGARRGNCFVLREDHGQCDNRTRAGFAACAQRSRPQHAKRRGQRRADSRLGGN